MAEVLFAIMVLAIGLILLAAAFPVGIKQAEKTQDATNAALIAQHAFAQLTKVVAFYTRPDNAWAPVAPGHPAPMTDYAGKPLTIGLLDGAMATDSLTEAPVPDLRAKLIYPNWPPDNAATPLVPVRPNTAASPTLSDGRPQNPAAALTSGQIALGRAADVDAASQHATFLNVWGYRFEGSSAAPIWHENVQWAFPADRRYYWYAFYRQLQEDPAGYLSPLGTDPTWTGAPARLNAVRSDHQSRRTYRVLIIPCKVAPNQKPILTPQEVLQRGGTPADYANQWFDPTGTNTGTPPDWMIKAWRGLAPMRIPVDDDLLANPADIEYENTSAGTWLYDRTGGVGYLAAGIANSRIRRGDIMLDAWANVYQIIDVGTNSVRIDRPIPGLPNARAAIASSVLPLWFNPNALAVFPTIVTKQADLP